MSDQLELWGEQPIRHNVFFAARPNATAATRIEGIARELATSRGLAAAAILPQERLHVSLFFVGEFAGRLPSATIEDAQAGADTVAISPFTVVFDRVATFGGGSNGKHPLVLAGGDGAIGLFRLQEALSLALMKVGVKAPRSSGTFTPHMTLMYAEQKCDMAIAPLSWTVDSFALIDSSIGLSQHRVARQWSLRETVG